MIYWLIHLLGPILTWPMTDRLAARMTPGVGRALLRHPVLPLAIAVSGIGCGIFMMVLGWNGGWFLLILGAFLVVSYLGMLAFLVKHLCQGTWGSLAVYFEIPEEPKP